MEAGASRRRQRRFRLGVVALVAAAAATSFYGLTSWPLFGDEFSRCATAPARHVEARAGPGDLVLADHRGPFNYYTPSLESRPLRRDTEPLDSIGRSVAGGSPDADADRPTAGETSGSPGEATAGTARLLKPQAGESAS